jgi:hypothetical protein
MGQTERGLAFLSCTTHFCATIVMRINESEKESYVIHYYSH